MPDSKIVNFKINDFAKLGICIFVDINLILKEDSYT